MDVKPKTTQDPSPATDLAAQKSVAGKTDDKKAEKQKEPFKSKGHKLHAWSTYVGIDVIFNAISGVAFAYWGNYSKMGKKLWKEPVTNGFKAALKPIIKDEQQLLASAEKGRMFASIIAGGMLFTVPPLMVLENKKVKKKIVKFYDRLIYGKEKCDNDPKLQESHDNIGNEPEKGFVTGNLARYAALAPLLAIVLIPKTQKLSDKHFFKPLEKFGEKVVNKLGIHEATAFKNVSRAEASERWQFIRENAAMDVGLEAPYAALHYALYGAFAAMAAKGKSKKKGGEKEVEAIVPISEIVAEPIVEAEQKKHAASVSRQAAFSAREVPAASFADRAAASDAITQEHGAAR